MEGRQNAAVAAEAEAMSRAAAVQEDLREVQDSMNAGGGKERWWNGGSTSLSVVHISIDRDTFI